MTNEFATIITAEDLAKHLNDPNWLIVDCTYTSSAPLEGYLHFLDEHIPSAVYADLSVDLASKPTPTTGRHPLPDPVKFGRLLMDWGVTEDTQVVCYDLEGGASAAARLWWLLHAVGHHRAAVLSGGFPSWLFSDQPLESGTASRKKESTLTQIRFDPDYQVNAAQVEKLIGVADWLIIDARSPLRHSGLEEQVDRTGGRIPGSISLPYGVLLDDHNKLHSRDRLTQIFSDTRGKVRPDHLIIYCGSSVISPMIKLALDHVGSYGSKLYIGSWSDWITNPNHLIATR